MLCLTLGNLLKMAETWWGVLLIALAAILASCVSGASRGNREGNLDLQDFPYYTKLDQGYELQWNLNTTHIVFRTKVKTTGYVGFGISDHGRMFPADIIIGWVKDGKVYFKDRHASGHFMPAVDTQQDWHLISGSEDGQYTTLTMMRLLDTCDSDDMPITTGTTRLIFAYSANDPDWEDDIPYHGSTRGTKSVLLLDPPANEKAKNNLPDDVTTIDFLNGNYSVPSKDTTYSCNLIKLPPLKGKHHVIRYEPAIQKGHEKLVHHMLLYYCQSPIDESLVGTQYECYNAKIPDGVPDNCDQTGFAWAIGGTGFDYPKHVGFSLGEVGDPVYFKLEIHYDNIHMRDDMVDNSGLRLYLTKQIRQHDAGLMAVGINVDAFQIIPPYTDNFLSRGHCGDCLSSALADEDIHIFADFLHSHLLGKKLTTRHIRNGTELAPIQQDDHFDFNYQETRLLPEERTVTKDDVLFTDCVYDSSRKINITYGGLSTRHEMCISFLLYYPKNPLSICFSRPLYTLNDDTQDIWTTVRNMDFTKASARKTFEDMINKDRHVSICLTGAKYSGQITSTPKILHPYRPENQCGKT